MKSLRLALLVATAAVACRPAAPPPVAAPVTQAVVAPVPAPAAPLVSPESTFGRINARLSEPGGYFASENVVSNELSYLHVLDGLRRTGVKGGAYIGVGPDQNFSYIAAIKPEVAFMFDIRRDDMIEHLMFKAVFAMTRNRMEYLCTLMAKPAPPDVAAWTDRPLAEMIAYLDKTPASVELARASEQEIEKRIAAFGIRLDGNDITTASMYRAAFIREGLDVQYNSIDNGRMSNMPVWRDLLVEVDRAGNQLNYLTADSLFQVVRKMEAENRIIPVTGNAAGASALRAVGDEIRSRGLVVSALYMSNVEQYLFRDGFSFPVFAANVKTLPRDSKSVIIRSLFSGGRGSYSPYIQHPLAISGYNSTQELQTIDTFVTEFDAGRLITYGDLFSHGYLPP